MGNIGIVGDKIWAFNDQAIGSKVGKSNRVVSHYSIEYQTSCWAQGEGAVSNMDITALVHVNCCLVDDMIIRNRYGEV